MCVSKCEFVCVCVCVCVCVFYRNASDKQELARITAECALKVC